MFGIKSGTNYYAVWLGALQKLNKYQPYLQLNKIKITYINNYDKKMRTHLPGYKKGVQQKYIKQIDLQGLN